MVPQSNRHFKKGVPIKVCGLDLDVYRSGM